MRSIAAAAGAITLCLSILHGQTGVAQRQGEIVDISVRRWDAGGPVGGIAVASNGDVWYSLPQSSSIGRLDVKTGARRVFSVNGNAPTALQAGSDGSVWFASDEPGAIGRVNGRSGKVEQVRRTDGVVPTKLAMAPNGNVWFMSRASARLGLVNARTNALSYTAPAAGERQVLDLAVTSQGSVVFVQDGSKAIVEVGQDLMQIGRYELPAPNEKPDRISIGSDGIALYTDSSRGFVGSHDRRSGWAEYSVGQYAAGDNLIAVSGGLDGYLSIGVVTREGLALSRIKAHTGESERPAPHRRFVITRGPVSASVMVPGNQGDLWFISEGSSVLTRVVGIAAGALR
jgi:streptogramin lyase